MTLLPLNSGNDRSPHFSSVKQLIRPWKYQLKTAEARIGFLEKQVASLQEDLRCALDQQGYFEDFRDLMSPLVPYRSLSLRKVRIGNGEDGGYVMLDDFNGVVQAISLGIAKEVSWDLAIAERGIAVVQFDPSVTAPPKQHSRFQFYRRRVVSKVSEPDKEWSMVGLPAPVVTGKLLLKIDVEGCEWDILDGMYPQDLERFQQIVVEFHDLHRYVDPQWRARASRVFSKLTRCHQMVHVHGNNYNASFVAGNLNCPRDLEMSFALKQDMVESDEIFPTPLDRPNKKSIPDHYLGNFRF